MLPLLPIAGSLIAGGTAINGYYDISRSLETRKYWNDYRRHTRRDVKYPYRAGYNDIYKAVGNTMRSSGYMVGFGNSWYSSGYRVKPKKYDYMYS